MALLAVPFLDGKGPRGRVLLVIGAIALGYATGMTAWGYRSWLPVLTVLATAALTASLGWATRTTKP